MQTTAVRCADDMYSVRQCMLPLENMQLDNGQKKNQPKIFFENFAKVLKADLYFISFFKVTVNHICILLEFSFSENDHRISPKTEKVVHADTC